MWNTSITIYFIRFCIAGSKEDAAAKAERKGSKKRKAAEAGLGEEGATQADGTPWMLP